MGPICLFEHVITAPLKVETPLNPVQIVRSVRESPYVTWRFTKYILGLQGGAD